MHVVLSTSRVLRHPSYSVRASLTLAISYEYQSPLTTLDTPAISYERRPLCALITDDGNGNSGSPRGLSQVLFGSVKFQESL